MKLYMHPVSTGARAVRLFIAENNIPCDEVLVDLMAGEQRQESYARLNPSRLVPMLEDGDFRLTESSAILKYLADKYALAAYPKDLQARARVNELMDWFNTQFSRDFGFGLVYPQILPHHKRRSDEAQAAVLEWGLQRAQEWLRVLDQHLIGPDKAFLCGDAPTIADYLGSTIATLGDGIGCEFADYPNVRRWLDNMRGLPSWPRVNQAFAGFAAANQGRQFVHA